MMRIERSCKTPLDAEFGFRTSSGYGHSLKMPRLNVLAMNRGTPSATRWSGVPSDPQLPTVATSRTFHDPHRIRPHAGGSSETTSMGSTFHLRFVSTGCPHSDVASPQGGWAYHERPSPPSDIQALLFRLRRKMSKHLLRFLVEVFRVLVCIVGKGVAGRASPD